MAESGNVVKIFLEKINLEKYSGRLVGQGYQTALDLCLLNEEDLNLISITDKEDREKILQAGRKSNIYLYVRCMTSTPRNLCTVCRIDFHPKNNVLFIAYNNIALSNS